MDPAQPAGGANCAAFRLTPDGRLTSRLSTQPIDPAISASQALVSPVARLVFVISDLPAADHLTLARRLQTELARLLRGA